MHLEQFIGSEFVKGQIEYSIDEIKRFEHILLFFAAHWSPPCMSIIGFLKDFYTAANQEKVSVEIIQISCDFNNKEFDAICENIGWAFIPFEKLGVREIITRHYDVVGIPTIILIDKQGSVISRTILNDIASKGAKECIESWSKQSSESSRSY